MSPVNRSVWLWALVSTSPWVSSVCVCVCQHSQLVMHKEKHREVNDSPLQVAETADQCSAENTDNAEQHVHDLDGQVLEIVTETHGQVT